MMFSKVGNSLLIRSGVVFVAILAVTGFATGVIPVRCLVGKACAPQSAATATLDASAPAGSSQTLAADNLNLPGPSSSAAAVQTSAASEAAPVQLVADVVPAKPTITSNDVIASTFALLPAEMQKPVLDGGSARPKPLTAASTAPASGDLKTRKVRTLTVRSDGTPMLPDEMVAQAYANNAPSSAPESPAIDAATRISAGEEPVASAEPPAKPVDKPAKKTASIGPTGKTATIAGSGSNVRAAPSKSGKVLFVLGAGEKVKVGDNSKGWIKITDDQGRSGWVYQSFLN